MTFKGVWARRGVRCVIVVAMGCSQPAWAVQGPSAETASARQGQTIQQQFQAGADALAAAENEKALEIYSALEARIAKNARSLAIVRVRKGIALVQLGRRQEARVALTAGLSALPEGDASLREDRYNAEIGMARIGRTDLDYVEALDHYTKARAIANGPNETAVAMLGQLEMGTFVDPQAALAVADAVVAQLAGMKTPAPSDVAQVQTARGRLLMNLGRFSEAQSELDKAVSKLGGLTLKVNYNDLVSRSDAAIAAKLAGHQDRALDYLVYTGAGRLPKQDFTRGVDMTLPMCGVGGITPQDVAVVELGIGDSGEVAYARPIYASRPGDMGLIFAREVAQWSWQPEQVKEIPMLFRFVTRLELRCTTSINPPALFVMAKGAFDEWAQGAGGRPFTPTAEDEARRRTELLQELELRRNGGGTASIELVPVLAQLIANKTFAQAETATAIRELRAIPSLPAMSPLASLYLDHGLLSDSERTRGAHLQSLSRWSEGYRSQPVAHAIARLTYYDELRPGAKAANRALLDELAADDRLAGNPMLRTAVLIRRAALRARTGDLAGAQQDYAATGRSDQECSIVDARPQMRSSPTSNDYPIEIVRRGVEGWTKVEFDVSADGKTLNQRAVVSYPPFIFSNAGQRIMKVATFEQSYRPAGGLGCSGGGHNINFRMR